MHVRVCPECDEEYRPDIATCADCGVDLLDHFEDEQGRVVSPAGEVVDRTPAEEGERVALQPLFSGPAGDLKPLADALLAASVPMRLVPDPNPARGLVLAVVAEDVPRAKAAVAALLRDAELDVTELAPDEAADGDAGYAACPACEAPLAPGAAFCPDCGLELGARED